MTVIDERPAGTSGDRHHPVRPTRVPPVVVPPHEWPQRPACADVPPDRWEALFSSPGDADDEPPFPPKEALAYCDVCPVRLLCLNWALSPQRDADGNTFYLQGVLGGTSSYQRRQLRRPMERRSCPACGSGEMYTENRHEVCMSCGVSWPAL